MAYGRELFPHSLVSLSMVISSSSNANFRPLGDGDNPNRKSLSEVI